MIAAPPCLRFFFIHLNKVNEVNDFSDLTLSWRIVRLYGLVADFSEAERIGRGDLIGLSARKALDKLYFNVSHTCFLSPFSAQYFLDGFATDFRDLLRRAKLHQPGHCRPHYIAGVV
jgi:hypothetical protein